MPFTIALPKGRLGEDAENAMIKGGVVESAFPKDSRKLIFDVGNDIHILLVRAWDVPAYVEMGTADMGVCGKDDLLEHEADVFELMDLGFGACRMSLASRNGITREDLLARPIVRVASKYPVITRKYFQAVSVQAEIIKLYGSVELAAVTGMADCIVDLVSTGGTLRENGLGVIEDLFGSTARLVVNRASYYRHLDKVNDITERIRSVLAHA